jgi:hypothetical protein
MRVDELMEKLRTLPQDAIVLVSAESDLTEPADNAPAVRMVHRNRGEKGDPCGEFEEHTEGYCFHCDEGRPTIQAVAIER